MYILKLNQNILLRLGEWNTIELFTGYFYTKKNVLLDSCFATSILIIPYAILLYEKISQFVIYSVPF